MQQKIVITGAPGTGKTTVIKQLEAAGFTCLHEIIRTMTLEAKKGIDSQEFTSNPLTFVEDPSDFNKKILNGRISQYRSSVKMDVPIIFFDRAIPDVLAYMDFFKQDYGQTFENACVDHSYSSIFLLPPWKEIYISDNERFESFDEAVHIHNHLKNTYSRFGYDPLEVPTGRVEHRVDYILNSIKGL